VRHNNKKKQVKEARTTHDTQAKELFVLYDKLMKRKESMVNMKESLKKNMTLPKNIDCLISDSIKKCKKKQVEEELEKSARKERIRLNKKFLSERNRMIRIMNAKKVKKPNKSVTKIDTQPKVVIKIHKEQSRHRAELGLELLDLKKKYINSEQNCKGVKKIQSEVKTKYNSANKKSKTLCKMANKMLSKMKKKDYINYLIPEKESKKSNVDSELMDNIKIELLSEISSNHIGLKYEQAGNKKTDKRESQKNLLEIYNNITVIKCKDNQKTKKRSKEELRDDDASLDHQKFSNIFQGATYKSQNEKVIHISNINTLEDIKEDPPKVILKKPKPTETRTEQANPEATSSPLTKYNHGSEVSPSFKFDKNPFEDFTEKKMQELLKADQVSAIIGMREQVLKYKESTEKQYINKMYKSKQYSFKTYQRKCRELEKWVIQERKEIKKTKTTLLEAWRKTAIMIDEVNQNTMQLRKRLKRNALSHNSNSNISLLDSSRPVTDRNYAERLFSDTSSKDDKSCGNLEEIGFVSDDHNKNMPLRVNDPVELSVSDSDNLPLVRNNRPVGILIEELTSPTNKVPIVQSPTEELKQLKVNPGNTRNKLESLEDLQAISSEMDSNTISEQNKGKLVDELTNIIYEAILKEAIPNKFPQREVVTSEILFDNTEEQKVIGISSQSQVELMQLLASKKHEGIKTDEDFITQYIDELFTEVCDKNKSRLISEINKSLAKSPLEVLTNLQNPEYNHMIQNQLPHEINPVVSLSTYLVLEVKYSNLPYNEYIHIHNKAIFDAVNEALNLIRPYGLNGEPMPWSIQSRILFKSIIDRNVIIKNIKNMVLDWASFEVGTLPKEEFLIEGKLDEDYFAEMREKQLATLLAQEVL